MTSPELKELFCTPSYTQQFQNNETTVPVFYSPAPVLGILIIILATIFYAEKSNNK